MIYISFTVLLCSFLPSVSTPYFILPLLSFSLTFPLLLFSHLLCHSRLEKKGGWKRNNIVSRWYTLFVLSGHRYYIWCSSIYLYHTGMRKKKNLSDGKFHALARQEKVCHRTYSPPKQPILKNYHCLESLPFNTSLSSVESSTVKHGKKPAAFTSRKRKQSSEEEQGKTN